ncbi:MAG: ABC transporter ATP-binding protein [Bacteroidetes bacterium]|nr:ABC transporter ATP-binding protein [Bacteroidota bacterium]
MKITLSEVGKRYNRDWIFKNVTYTFQAGEAYVILGSNGSGKSTLLQLIAGNQVQSTGLIEYQLNDKTLPVEKIFPYISFASPYLELIEEYSLTEILQFHAQFKPFFKSLSIPAIIELTGLVKSKDKELKYFSSGMKQRVRLALAILSDTPILFLDEPTSNLDKKGIDWYNELIQKFTSERIVIVCSNHQKHEYDFCKQQLLVEDYK